LHNVSSVTSILDIWIKMVLPLLCYKKKASFLSKNVSSTIIILEMGLSDETVMVGNFVSIRPANTLMRPVERLVEYTLCQWCSP